MIDLAHGFKRIEGIPEGFDAQLVSQAVQESWHTIRCAVLYIVRDDERLSTIENLVQYFDSTIKIITIPAWDCLPYDRVSPNQDILAARTLAFSILANQKSCTEPTLILMPLHAALQRMAPLKNFENTQYILEKNKVISRDSLLEFLIAQGYHRVQTVRESGEFAIRGSLIDLYPPSSALPVRIDYFDDEIENIKSFDPIEQTTRELLDKVLLTSTTEILLTPENIAQFRSRYRALFGAINSDDLLFESISESQRMAGMEHWLPLFFDHTETIFDWITENCPIFLDHQIDLAFKERTTQIMDFYQSRCDQQKEHKKSLHSSLIYNPVPPPLLFLNEIEWQNVYKRLIVRELLPFGVESALAKQVPNYSSTKPEDLYDQLKTAFNSWLNDKKTITIVCYSAGSLERIKQLFIEHNLYTKQLDFIILPLEHGYISQNSVMITEQDIFGDRLTRTAKKRRRNELALLSTTELSMGDFVVHKEHGIGQFDGLITLNVDGTSHDCVRLIYADNDKLFVPVENLDVLSRFGSEQATAQLDRLGGASWQARKARVKKRLLDMAQGLIDLAAKRKMTQAPEITIPAGSYQEFCARFPYQETEDQERSIADVLADLHGDHAMDRLVCGDVGFGKTEVAMRAAFVTAMAGLQVAIIVPTTLLSRQHFANFTRRFKGFPLRIAQLSRMVSTGDAEKYRQELRDGTVDIVIGTHALLADKVAFKSLGLMIIDEEQNFGVKQKEKLKNMRDNVHVLTLTATPIPRTLQMAMSGIRDLSLMATPPIDRLAVRTSVLPFDPLIIREAILREMYRGGQIFYVCPRLSDIDDVQKMLQELVPDLKIVQAHGQMSPTALDERMTAFYEGQYHLLLATNIIESGLDIPNANTLIVHRSDLLGLSQLYQIRGRIGRSKIRGYAYFTYKNERLLTESAKQRLHVISTLDTLGAGFQLASYDMDIRGAGNLLGEEQSGHIKEIGVELYQMMLEEALQTVRSGELNDINTDNDWSPLLNLGLTVLIPENYVTDLPARLTLYRRLAAMNDQEAIDAFAVELVDRFGPVPPEVKNLFDVMQVKHLCKQASIERIDAGPKGAVITFRKNTFSAVDQLLLYVQKQAGTVKIRPDQKLTIMRAWEDLTIRLQGVRKISQDLADMIKK
jgi:transcription-repair coupling factor (superfamily II helicase)